MTTSLQPPSSAPTSKRRRLRITLWGLVVLALAMAGGSGWLVYRAKVQRDAVAVILRSGGSVVYDWEYDPGDGFAPPRQPNAPRWLVDRLGLDYFGQVLRARFGRGSTKDDDLAAISGLVKLRELDLSSTEVTDEGLAYLRGLVEIKSLFLGDTKISGSGLVHLRGMKGLQTLHLARTRVTDLGPLAGSLDNLIWLDLSGTPITDEGLAPLVRSTNLSFLLLQDVAITDAGLAHLRRASKIDSLLLDRTPITDAGIDALPQFFRLTSISLTKTKVSSDRVAKLRQEYPHAGVGY